jgi:YVTN family beta-propeller protein
MAGDCLRPNDGSATISVIDTATDKVTDTLRFGKKPRGIAISRGRLAPLSVPINPVRSWWSIRPSVRSSPPIPLGESPEAIYLSPDGKWLSVCHRGERQRCDRRHDVAQGRPAHQNEGQESGACGVEPGRQVALRERGGSRLGRHRRRCEGRGRQVGEGAATDPRASPFLPDGTRAYVAAENADTVNVFDTARHEVITRIKAGARSNGIIAHPDGHRIFVTSGGKGTVQVIDTATNTIVKEIRSGGGPGTWR